MKIRYYCSFGSPTGYARAAHDYLLAIHRTRFCEIDIKPLDGIDFAAAYLEDRYKDLLVCLDRSFFEPDITICHATPKTLSQTAWHEKVPIVALTTWETDPLPFRFENALRKYDYVVTPSSFCQKLMHPYAEVIPHCYDHEFWTPQIKPISDDFCFYTIGSWTERKNILGVIKAYFSVFRKEDPVKLVVVCPDPDMNRIEWLVKTSGIEDDLPPVHVIQKRLDENQLLKLHRESDCFVSATRGEGWHLGAFEAACLGKPIVMPRYGGQFDYLEDYENWLEVSYQMTFAWPDPVIAQGRLESRIATGTICRQVWAEPNLTHLGNQMRIAFEKKLPDKPDPDFPIKYSYETVGPQFVAFLKEAIDEKRKTE